MLEIIKKDIEITGQESMQTQTKLAKAFHDFIQDNSQAIKEINALQDKQNIILDLRKIVYTFLPDVVAEEVVDAGILQYSAEPYKGYLAEKSKDRNADIGKANVIAYHALYEAHLQDFLATKIKEGDIGKYFFTMKKLDLPLVTTTPNTITYTHDSTLAAYVQLHATKDIEPLEKDAVDMAGHKQDITPDYLKVNVKDLTKDFDESYKKLMADWFIPACHAKAIEALGDYMNMFKKT